MTKLKQVEYFWPAATGMLLQCYVHTAIFLGAELIKFMRQVLIAWCLLFSDILLPVAYCIQWVIEWIYNGHAASWI